MHAKSREEFLQFLDKADEISEEDSLEKSYAWMAGYPLHTVLISSYAHYHIEHLALLHVWLREQGHPTITR